MKGSSGGFHMSSGYELRSKLQKLGLLIYFDIISISRKVSKPTHIKISKKHVLTHGICGTLSKMISGKGGYLSISGTLSWTMTMTKAVTQDTKRT